MKTTVTSLMALLLITSVAWGKSDSEKLACDSVKEKIRTIEAKMRAGYTRAQGERYEARLRELKAQRYRLCR